jgi:hypothetical protein
MLRNRSAFAVNGSDRVGRSDAFSRADIQMTKAIVDIAAPLGISVHDHPSSSARTGMRV